MRSGEPQRARSSNPAPKSGLWPCHRPYGNYIFLGAEIVKKQPQMPRCVRDDSRIFIFAGVLPATRHLPVDQQRITPLA